MTIGIRFVSRFRFSRSHTSNPSISGSDRIEEDQVGPTLGDRVEGLLTGVHLERFETLGPHEMGQDVIGVALIVNHQNGARHGQDPKGLRIV